MLKLLKINKIYYCVPGASFDANGYYQEVEYFIGAYCGNDGASINLGMFTDDACTEFVDDSTSGRSTFYSMAGEDLP